MSVGVVGRWLSGLSLWQLLGADCSRRVSSHGNRRGEHTKSANESSSCPINDDFWRHLATFPSMKSKNSPNGMKVMAM
jgi:hypothetical protein